MECGQMGAETKKEGAEKRRERWGSVTRRGTVSGQTSKKRKGRKNDGLQRRRECRQERGKVCGRIV